MKQGSAIVRENVIVLYLAHEHCICYKRAKYRTMTFSLVSLLFTPPLPSNPISHQLSHREGFFFTCITYSVYVYIYASPQVQLLHVPLVL